MSGANIKPLRVEVFFIAHPPVIFISFLGNFLKISCRLANIVSMKRRKLRNNAWRKLPEAGQEMEKILLSLNKGVLRGKYKTKWYVSGRLFDFFFPEIRLAILLDGSKEKSEYNRLQKVYLENFCEDEWITLLYIKEDEIMYDRDKLIEKLRVGYRAAKKLIKSKIR